MDNLSSGAVLGVLERQSKGDEWMLHFPPTCLGQTNSLPGAWVGMGWGREIIRPEHCNKHPIIVNIAQKLKIRLPKNIK